MSMLAMGAFGAGTPVVLEASGDKFLHRNPLKQEVPPGSHRSHKGSVVIHVPSIVVLVHPPGLGENDVPREDTLLEGSLEIIMKETRIAKRIKVSLTATCVMLPNGRDVVESKLFERTIEIGGIHGAESEGIKLEKGSQRFAFSIIIPSTIATYDRHPLARVTHALHAVVEGMAVPEGRSFSLFSASRKGKERSASRPSSRAPSRHQSRAGSRDVSPTRYSRRDDSPVPDRLTAELANLMSGPSTPPLMDDAKPLKGYFSTAKLVVIAANPLPAGGPTLPTLAFRKESHLASVGDWKLSLQSDALSVGGYIRLAVLFMNLSPKCTIFAIRLLLAQKYALKLPDDPSAPPVVCPQRNFLVSLHGVVPEEKRPGPNAPSLWKGKAVGTGKEVDDKNWVTDDLKIKGSLKRLPDDTKLRPSTVSGTDTPVRVSHEFLLHVFFSVEGQNDQGTAMSSSLEPGELRAMTVVIPTEIPSCVLTFDRLALPEYSEFEEVSAKPTAICACGYTLEELARRELTELGAAEGDDDIDRIDVDSLTADGRGRSRGREAAQRKAEFVHVNENR